jgi:hypothetical protein
MNYATVILMCRKGGALLALVLIASALATLVPDATWAHIKQVAAQNNPQTDMLLDWNEHTANAIVSAGQVPPQGLISLAMVHTAIYDAVNAIEGYPFHPYGVEPSVVSPASPEAAAAAAAHDILVSLFPDQQEDLDSKYMASLEEISDGPDESNGISAGQQTAAGILALRANDGRDAVVPYTPGSRTGIWAPTPPGFLAGQAPEAPYVLPWILNSPSQFRALPPPDLTSESWTTDYNEVKSLGGMTGSTRTPEQTDIGRFWSDHPMLQWNRAWRGIGLDQELSLMDSARFFAMLTTASSDALIACWDSKYFYNFWRPVTAIRAGDTDGNPNTEPDAEWIGLVTTPNHPEYPAAHGCFSAASTETLKFFFNTDELDFTIDSTVPDLTNDVRNYDNVSQALQEVLDARVYGGMHYRNSSDKGAIIGKQVSHFVTRHFFKPRNNAMMGTQLTKHSTATISSNEIDENFSRIREEGRAADGQDDLEDMTRYWDQFKRDAASGSTSYYDEDENGRAYDELRQSFTGIPYNGSGRGDLVVDRAWWPFGSLLPDTEYYRNPDFNDRQMRP